MSGVRGTTNGISEATVHEPKTRKEKSQSFFQKLKKFGFPKKKTEKKMEIGNAKSIGTNHTEPTEMPKYFNEKPAPPSPSLSTSPPPPLTPPPLLSSLIKDRIGV